MQVFIDDDAIDSDSRINLNYTYHQDDQDDQSDQDDQDGRDVMFLDQTEFIEFLQVFIEDDAIDSDSYLNCISHHTINSGIDNSESVVSSKKPIQWIKCKSNKRKRISYLR